MIACTGRSGQKESEAIAAGDISTTVTNNNRGESYERQKVDRACNIGEVSRPYIARRLDLFCEHAAITRRKRSS